MLYIFYLEYAGECGERGECGELQKRGGLEKLSGREVELWSPILKLALFFNRYINGLYEKMVDFAVRKSEEKLTENLTETPDVILVKTLTSMVTNDDYYKVGNIRDAMAEYFDEPQKWLTSKWVGNALRRLGFTVKRPSKRGIQYLITVRSVKDLAERLGIENEGEIEAVVVDMQTWIKAVYESFRKHYIQSFNNVEFYHYFVDKFGVPKEEATKLLKQLKNDNLIFATYQGSWVWT